MTFTSSKKPQHISLGFFHLGFLREETSDLHGVCLFPAVSSRLHLVANLQFFSQRRASLNVLGDSAVLCALPGSGYLLLPVTQVYTAGVL